MLVPKTFQTAFDRYQELFTIALFTAITALADIGLITGHYPHSLFGFLSAPLGSIKFPRIEAKRQNARASGPVAIRSGAPWAGWRRKMLTSRADVALPTATASIPPAGRGAFAAGVCCLEPAGALRRRLLKSRFFAFPADTRRQRPDPVRSVGLEESVAARWRRWSETKSRTFSARRLLPPLLGPSWIGTSLSPLAGLSKGHILLCFTAGGGAFRNTRLATLACFDRRQCDVLCRNGGELRRENKAQRVVLIHSYHLSCLLAAD